MRAHAFALLATIGAVHHEASRIPDGVVRPGRSRQRHRTPGRRDRAVRLREAVLPDGTHLNPEMRQRDAPTR